MNNKRNKDECFYDYRARLIVEEQDRKVYLFGTWFKLMFKKIRGRKK